MVTLADKKLLCRDCKREFVFTAKEQEPYVSLGMEFEPNRCPECRLKLRQSRGKFIKPAQGCEGGECGSCGSCG